jgi:hypothetical protein
MKKILFLFAALLSLLLQAQSVQGELSKYNLKGKVSMVTEQAYTATEIYGEIKKENLVYTLIYKFDSRGNMIEESFKNSSIYRIEKYKHEYDANGNTIAINGFKTDGKDYKKQVFEIDDKGELVEVKFSNQGKFIQKKIARYDYDKTGNWQKQINFSCDNPILVVERTIVYFDVPVKDNKSTKQKPAKSTKDKTK